MDKTKKTASTSGSGNNGGDIPSRLARLESDVEYIKRDIGEIKSDIKDIRKEARSNFLWLLGSIGLPIYGYIIATIIKHLMS